MYIRIKKINNALYAYMSECKWSKRSKSPKQKFKKYLGRVYSFENNKKEFIPNLELDKLKFINVLLGNELVGHGFGLEEGNYLNSEIMVDLLNKSVKKGKKDVVVRLNEGFLCKESLERLYNFKELHNMDVMEAGKELGKRLIDCGIPIKEEIFVELFRKIYKNI